MERIDPESSSRGKDNLLSSSSQLIDNDHVSRVIETNRDVIDPKWEGRHAKLIYLIGPKRYDQLAYQARKFGKNPRALMATLVTKELQEEQKK